MGLLITFLLLTILYGVVLVVQTTYIHNGNVYDALDAQRAVVMHYGGMVKDWLFDTSRGWGPTSRRIAWALLVLSFFACIGSVWLYNAAQPQPVEINAGLSEVEDLCGNPVQVGLPGILPGNVVVNGAQLLEQGADFIITNSDIAAGSITVRADGAPKSCERKITLTTKR